MAIDKDNVKFKIVMNEQDANWLRASRLKEIVRWELPGSKEAVEAQKELDELENNIVRS